MVNGNENHEKSTHLTETWLFVFEIQISDEK